MRAFVEAFVGEELQLCGVFGAYPVRNLALEEGGVAAKRLQHRVLILPKQWFHEHRRVTKIGRHAHFGDADQMRLQDVIVYIAPLEQLLAGRVINGR